MSIADPSSDDNDIINAVPDVPSLFVDARLLNSDSIGNVAAGQVKYTINDSVFEDKESGDNALVEFEVQRSRADDKTGAKMDHDYDMYCSTPSGSESECEDGHPSDKPLALSVQEVPHGIIVNSQVYLTSHQWNTLIFIDVKMVKCAVCDVYSDLDKCLDHVSLDSHKHNLDMYKPLEIFDLSITRKVRNMYHCAVCNELFDAMDKTHHFDSKMHEGNVLFATNKASDIMYDFNIHNDKKDCYHFNENNINDNRFNDDHSTNDDVSVLSDYTNNENYINFQNNYFYNDFDDYEEIPTGTSYATMAKKPKINVQKFIEVDLGNKKVKVRFDSWHMIISPKLNRFYCMVCKKCDHMRLKAEHCSDVGHLKNLDKCKVVEAFEEYFIRQVDDKLYHCGHCNNLQLIHEMEDHVETNHPRKNKIFTDTASAPVVASPVKNMNNNNEKPNPTSNQNDRVGTPVKNYDKTIQKPQNDTIGAPVNTNTTILGPQYNRVSPPVNYDKTIQKPQNDTIGAPVNTNTTILGPQYNRVSPPVNYDKTIQKPQNDTIGASSNINKTVQGPHNNGVNTPVHNYDKTIQKPQNDTIGAALNTNNIIQRPQNNGVTTPVMQQPHTLIGYPVKYYDKTIQRPVINVSNINNDNVTNTNGNVINDRNKVNDAKMLGIFDNVVIFPFGFKLTIPMMSYNIVCRRPKDFYCALCDIICPENAINGHIYEIRHIELLHRTPFINPFRYNLIRAIREYLHCAICNMPVSAAKIYEHVHEPVHVNTLSKALGVVSSPINVSIPPPTVNIAPVKVTTQNVVKNVAVDVKTAVIMPKIVVEDKMAVNNENINPNSVQAVSGQKNDIKEDYNYTKGVVNDRKAVKEPIKSSEEEVPEEFNENLNDTFDSTADDVTFDMEEYVYLKLRNSYMKIANTSYNTLVHVGDGSRYCFVCNLQVDYVELQKHVDSRCHLENMEKYRFLDKYEDHLLRQIFLMYHCCICNVIITRKELKTHLEWPTHALQNENTSKNIKKTRKNEIKGGVKQIVVSTQKENIYLNEKEPKIQIHFNVEITNKADVPTTKKNDTPSNVAENIVQDASKKNKIIILKDNVMKVSWESWHGVSKIKNGFKCNLCQRELQTNDIEVHCSGEWHKYGLDKPFETQYAPALIRKINELTLNCLICNTEVSNKDHIVTEHINGKKHIKNYEVILNESSETNTYVDCDDDVLML